MCVCMHAGCNHPDIYPWDCLPGGSRWEQRGPLRCEGGAQDLNSNLLRLTCALVVTHTGARCVHSDALSPLRSQSSLRPGVIVSATAIFRSIYDYIAQPFWGMSVRAQSHAGINTTNRTVTDPATLFPTSGLFAHLAAVKDHYLTVTGVRGLWPLADRVTGEMLAGPRSVQVVQHIHEWSSPAVLGQEVKAPGKLYTL